MRPLKKIFLFLIAFACALLAAAALAALMLIAEPQWFLTSRTVAGAAQTFGGAYHPRWKSLAFRIRSLSFREKQVDLRLRDFCFEYADAGLEGCLKDADVSLDVRLYFFGVQVKKISRFMVSGDHLALDQSKSKTGVQAKKSAGPPVLLPAALRGITIGELGVDLPANELIQAGGGSIRAGLRLNMSPTGPRKMALKLEVVTSSGTVTRHYHGEAALVSDLLNGGDLTYLDARGRLEAEDVDARFKARIEKREGNILGFWLNTTARLPGRRAEAGLSGTKSGQDVNLTGSAGVWQSSGPVKSVQLKNCTLAARLKGDGWDTLKFDGDFELVPDIPGAAGSRVSLPKKLEGRLRLGARSVPGILTKDNFKAELSATVKPIKDWYEFYGGVEASVSGRTSLLQELEISHRFNFVFKVARFEDLVIVLAGTPYSIPAPANVLQGPLSLSVKSSGDPRSDAQELDYELLTGLTAGRQALKVKLNGKLAATGLWTPGRLFRSETDATLEDVAVQLPRFDIKGGVAVVLDGRIKTGLEADKAELAVKEARESPGKSPEAVMLADVRIKTVKPVLLYSNLAKDPIPVGLDIDLKIPSGVMEGAVELRPFRVEIFRRIASIDHIKFSGRAGSPLMDMDGLIVYKAAEAKIFIRLRGSVQKPRVEFESDPPMNQADIMAMLLFGKSPGEMDSDQQASAANTQTAVANSAFGLASLYLLASTPVDYVGYDPVTRTYTVKLRLPGGATLQVGSDGQSKGVQLRKRIASNLAIQTELTNTQTQGNVVTTLLEWYGRR